MIARTTRNSSCSTTYAQVPRSSSRLYTLIKTRKVTAIAIIPVSNSARQNGGLRRGCSKSSAQVAPMSAVDQTVSADQHDGSDDGGREQRAAVVVHVRPPR